MKVLVVNKYFGCAGIPDYSKIKIEKKKKKWEMEVPSDGYRQQSSCVLVCVFACLSMSVVSVMCLV